jgi:hypothetical protein
VRVALLTKEEAQGRGVPFNSPTSISGWLECHRKWAWRYLAKIYAPPNASAQLGTDTHKQLELYLTEARPIDFSHPSGEILQSGLHFFPAPLTPGMKGEGAFYFLSERTGFIYMGKKDVELPPGVPQPQLDFDGSVPIVEDLKTTGSIADYAKSVDDLRFDPQSAMYAFDAMTRYDASGVDLGWIYCQTRGTKKSKPVTLRMLRPEAERLFDAVESVAEEIQVARDGMKDSAAREFVLSLPANPAACSAFGGCPYKPLCNLSPSQKARAQMSGNLISSLRARVQGTPSPAPSPPPEPAPAEEPIPEALTRPYVPKSAEGAAILGLPPPIVHVHVGEDPINPPESKLPPAPLPEKASAEDVKEKKVRKPREKKVTEVATTSSEDVKAADVVASDGAEKKVASGACDLDVGFTLYVDCLPEGGQVTRADELIDRANDIVVERQKATEEPVQHYSFLSYGKGKGALSLALEEVIDGMAPSAVFVTSGSDALATLSKRAARIVRSVR